MMSDHYKYFHWKGSGAENHSVMIPTCHEDAGYCRQGLHYCLYHKVEEIPQLVSNKSREATICKNVKRICKYSPGLSCAGVSKCLRTLLSDAEKKMSQFSIPSLADTLHFPGFLGTFIFSFLLLTLLCVQITPLSSHLLYLLPLSTLYETKCGKIGAPHNFLKVSFSKDGTYKDQKQGIHD